ncbi:hypothetical protein PNIG_b0004 [Pseudoalteromonas nigrifaciens]|uniref:Uncharacterized protein n=1 Tax=Pseudoalteromonas nigrifaciens TaxID=28109 RepID=A0AAC9XZ40_9GAMM|nr:hypothetical protein PNIG_b0004 [Pseudoalteromonas nigrifaciens]
MHLQFESRVQKKYKKIKLKFCVKQRCKKGIKKASPKVGWLNHYLFK